MLAHRTVGVVVGGFALLTLATGLVNATLPKFTTGLGLGASGYGWALAALACGMIVGEALTGAVAERIEPRWLGAALAVMGCLFFAFAWSGSAVLALLLLALFGVANGFAEVAMMTAIHQQADVAYQGRVFGVGSTIWRTTMLGPLRWLPQSTRWRRRLRRSRSPQAFSSSARFSFRSRFDSRCARRPQLPDRQATRIVRLGSAPKAPGSLRQSSSSAATTREQNCVPVCSRISASAASIGRAGR